MVHIINGEIVQDDDPRVLQKKNQMNHPIHRNRNNNINTMNSQYNKKIDNVSVLTNRNPLLDMADKIGIGGNFHIPSFWGMEEMNIPKIYVLLAAIACYFYGYRVFIFTVIAFIFLRTQRQIPNRT